MNLAYKDGMINERGKRIEAVNIDGLYQTMLSVYPMGAVSLTASL